MPLPEALAPLIADAYEGSARMPQLRSQLRCCPSCCPAGLLLALIQLAGRSWAMTLGMLPSLSALLLDVGPLVSAVAVRRAQRRHQAACTPAQAAYWLL